MIGTSRHYKLFMEKYEEFHFTVNCEHSLLCEGLSKLVDRPIKRKDVSSSYSADQCKLVETFSLTAECQILKTSDSDEVTAGSDEGRNIV